MSRVKQRLLFDEPDGDSSTVSRTASTFADNLRLPVHRWFRYSAGFSAHWAEAMIRDAMRSSEARILDPFAGSGTTLLAAENAGCESYGLESHPFVHRVARAKLQRRTDPESYGELIRSIRARFREIVGRVEHYPELIRKCYSAESLLVLDRLRRSLVDLHEESPRWELCWLTLCAILRPTSSAGTAQWQYILPRKEKKGVADPLDAFDSLARLFARDLQHSRETVVGPHAVLKNGDARTCADVPDRFATLVLTSPPYPNNYDYADATRLEMCFFGEIDGWGDLQEKVRTRLVRSCSQHVPPKDIDLEEVLSDADVAPITGGLSEVCRRLAEIRLTKGGRKTYHLMVACYFLDLARVWRSLRRVCNDHCRVCFVIGDSAPYGVYVPVAEWMGALAIAAGFSRWMFEKTRDRNVKWKNRKHRVPLCEGRLWVDG